MAQNLHIHKNDTAFVVSGAFRKKQGKVLKVFPDTQRVIIENVNIIKRATRPSQKNPQGGVVQKEGSIRASNVMVVCPKCNKPTRIGHKHIKDATSGSERVIHGKRYSS
jgi:large subunit ribosomal protein L24